MGMIETKTANAIRVLSADAIQKAKSGHPGLPLGCASAAYELWANHMRHNPADPKWVDRDRFILSGGHGSMLLYSLFHLFGPTCSLDEQAVTYDVLTIPSVGIIRIRCVGLLPHRVETNVSSQPPVQLP